MGGASPIQWTDCTENPIRAIERETGAVGWHCTHASPGCLHCYAENMNRWVGTGLPYKPQSAAAIDLFLDDKMLAEPLGWKDPQKIFWCSMTDPFGDFVSREWMLNILGIAALTPHHTHQIVTKRPARMAEELLKHGTFEWIYNIMGRLGSRHLGDPHPYRTLYRVGMPWPMRNVWLITSVEDQRRADERREPMRTLAEAGWITGVSFEPALEVVTWRGWEFLRWLVGGHESGRHARVAPADCQRAARDFCAHNHIAYFLKQWGEWLPASQVRPGQLVPGRKYREAFDGTELQYRVGKKNSGRMLDHAEWSQFPEAA